MTIKTTWDSETPASPALIEPLLDDMGLGKDDELRPENPAQKAEAREATKSYLLSILPAWDNNCTMGDWNTLGYALYAGYLAGLNHNINPLVA